MDHLLLLPCATSLNTLSGVIRGVPSARWPSSFEYANKSSSIATGNDNSTNHSYDFHGGEIPSPLATVNSPMSLGN